MNNLSLKTFIAKSAKEIDMALCVRAIVFIEEQKVPYSEERDEYDFFDKASHFLILENNDPISTGRVRFIEGGKIAKFERIAVRQHKRGTGIGALLTNEMMNFAKSSGAIQINLHAQVSAAAFYEKLGFCKYGEEFIDAGINHIAMKYMI